MRFLDEAEIIVRSGDGGSGCISFRKEKFNPKGGPDGGDGGDGGNVIVKASESLHTLADYASRKELRAQNGQSGRGKNQTGRTGRDVVIRVPVGTGVQDMDTGEVLADLIRHCEEVIVAVGGKGGKGNQHFATPTRRAPRIAQRGLPGQTRRIRLSLKCLADIGIIGLPNSGKSTLLSRLTRAHPRIDNYPFTTLVPNLGAITLKDEVTVTMADIPGLIEGASEGCGLGHRFLKHIERTRLLLHVLDITYRPVDNIDEDFHTLVSELQKYNLSLARKDCLVLINKIDLCSSRHRCVTDLQKALRKLGLESLPISALTGEGLEELKEMLACKLSRETLTSKPETAAGGHLT
jgi:GTP-binding protein